MEYGYCETSGCTGPKRKFKWVLDGFRCTELRYVDESSDLRFVGAERYAVLCCDHTTANF